MRSTHFSFRGTFRGAVISAVLAAATLAGTAFAADQATDKIGPHTRQLHGAVDATPAGGATSFTLDTERYGKVTVMFTTATVRGLGHGRGRARSFEISKVTDIKQGERVVV